MLFDVSFWALPAAVRVENGAIYQSPVVGREGVKRIQVSEAGLVRIEREKLPPLLIFGLASGAEIVAKEEPLEAVANLEMREEAKRIGIRAAIAAKGKAP